MIFCQILQHFLRGAVFFTFNNKYCSFNVDVFCHILNLAEPSGGAKDRKSGVSDKAERND